MSTQVKYDGKLKKKSEWLLSPAASSRAPSQFRKFTLSSAYLHSQHHSGGPPAGGPPQHYVGQSLSPLQRATSAPRPRTNCAIFLILDAKPSFEYAGRPGRRHAPRPSPQIVVLLFMNFAPCRGGTEAQQRRAPHLLHRKHTEPPSAYMYANAPNKRPRLAANNIPPATGTARNPLGSGVTWALYPMHIAPTFR